MNKGCGKSFVFHEPAPNVYATCGMLGLIYSDEKQEPMLCKECVNDKEVEQK